MNVNLTKLARYRPLTKSVRGNALVDSVAREYGVTPERVMKEFTLFLAVLIRRHIQNAVKTQKIAGRKMKYAYKPLSSRYNQTKPDKYKDKFWINSDFLIKNLKVWQLKKGDVYIGYRNNAVHKGTPYKSGQKRVKASDLMVYLERGTKKIPPRPLFTVIIRNIAKNIFFYLEMFVKNVRKGNIRL